jgi:hypothetical protein
MKKAKIMLSAIAIFAVVGGALAFKAKNAHFVYCATTAETVCSVNISSYSPASLASTGNIGIITTSFCTTAPTLPCTVTVPAYRLPND